MKKKIKFKRLNIKLFIDTAITSEIKDAAELGIISGVTTNPSLLAKSVRSLNDVITEILSIVDSPISAEVEEGNAEHMYKQAHEIVTMTNNNPNITIKLPMTADGVKVCSMLSKENIKTNVTLVFIVSRVVLAMEAGATFISPFMGRMDDYFEEHDSGYKLIKKINEVKKNYGYKSESRFYPSYGGC